jgi:hypothetical protein
MSSRDLDKDQLNTEIRRFLKLVGITSQSKLERAVNDAMAAGTLPESGRLAARMTLAVPVLGLEHVIDHEIDIGN